VASVPPVKIVQGDTNVSFSAPLRDLRGPAPLMGAVVLFKMAQQDGTKAVIGQAVVRDPMAQAGDPDLGWVDYFPTAQDVDTPGVYHAEYTVTFADGKQETFPSDSPNEIVIRALAA
jgi:hypothetical protein